jgi:hypothetical protein
MSNYNNEFKKLRSQILSSSKEKLLCISTTANINNPPVFIGSIRETETTIAGNIIIRDASILKDLVSCFDGVVSYFLVDCEIKNEVKNLESLILEEAKKSKVFVYKPNDFTVESLDVLLAGIFTSLRGLKILILGAGNIGSKIALKLCERGANVFLYDKDNEKTKKIIDGLNLIKRSDTLIKLVKNKENEAKGSNIILGCTPGIPVINKVMVNNLSKDAKIIDVGNGTVDDEAIKLALDRNLEILVLSSFGGYVGLIENWLFQRKFFGKERKRLIGDNRLIIIGVFGKKGDIIVDDVTNPAKFIGICDGKGDIISKDKSQVIFETLLAKIKDKKLGFQIKGIYDKI